MPFRSLTSTTVATRASTAVTVPAGVVDGDILIAMFMAQRVAASTTLTPPAGWTVIDSSRVKDSTGLTCDSAIYWKRAAGESGSYTFTNTSASTQLVVMAYSGEIASGSPVAATSKNFTTDPTSFGATASAFAVTTTANNEDLVYLAHTWVNGALTPPTGMTERFDGFLYTADQLIAVAGSSGPYFQNTNNTAAQPWSTFIVALTPAAAVGGVVGKGIPVVTVVGQAALAVTEVAAGKGGLPVTEALSRIGLPVTKVASGGLPVIYVTPP